MTHCPNICGHSPKVEDSPKTPCSKDNCKCSCDKIYNLNSEQEKRATALGFGKKSDFTRDLAKAPPPTRYESASLFDENKIKQKGYSLAVGRDVREW